MRDWLRRQRVRLGWWLVGRPPEAQVLLRWNPQEINVTPLSVGSGQGWALQWAEIPTGGEAEGQFWVPPSPSQQAP